MFNLVEGRGNGGVGVGVRGVEGSGGVCVKLLGMASTEFRCTWRRFQSRTEER